MSDTQHGMPDSSLGELFSHLTSDLSALMRDEVQLAKIELKEEVGRAARAGGLLGGAAFAGYMVVVTLSFALAWGLAELMAVGWAFLTSPWSGPSSAVSSTSAVDSSSTQ